MKKAHYIKEITRRIISDQLDLERLADLSNEEVIEQLCELPGIREMDRDDFNIFITT